MTTFKFHHGFSGSFSNAADWLPSGGPPGPGDEALFVGPRAGNNHGTVSGDATLDSFVGQLDDRYFTGNLTLLGTTGTALSLTNGYDSFSGTVVAPTVVLRATPFAGSGPAFEGTLEAGTVIISAYGQGGASNEVQFWGQEVTRQLSVTASSGSYAHLESIQGLWTNAGSVVVGGAGTGVLSISAGTTRIGYQGERGNLLLGNQAGGAGSVDVQGTLAVANLVRVGDGGTGVLTVERGGWAHAGALDVASGSNVTLGGFKESASSFATLLIDSGTIEAGGWLDGAGKLSVRHGFIDNGTISATGYLRIAGDVTDNGAMNIASGAVIHVVGDVLGMGTIAFASGGNADLVIGASPTIDPTLTGFGAGDAIRALNVDSVSYDPTDGLLTLFSDGVAEGSLTLAGNYAASGFQVTVQGHQGVVTYTGTPAHIG